MRKNPRKSHDYLSPLFSMHEFGTVYRAVKHRLTGLASTKERFLEAEALLQVPNRFENRKPGRPESSSPELLDIACAV